MLPNLGVLEFPKPVSIEVRLYGISKAILFFIATVNPPFQ